MREGQFSRTALGAAGRRAAHQVVDGARVFDDPLALRILGPDADAAVAEARADPAMRGLRLYVAMRSRFAEDAARRAIARGVRQVVVLGAGLDTFAYRVEPVEGLRVTEVDHPATQAEKRRRLAAAGIAAPSHVVYAGCDFETEDLAGALRARRVRRRAAEFLPLARRRPLSHRAGDFRHARLYRQIAGRRRSRIRLCQSGGLDRRRRLAART